MTADYFAELPAEDRAALAEIATRFLPLIPGADPDGPLTRETMLTVLVWQRLEIEVMDAHGAWLERVKAAIERSGREYNRATFLRYCALREHE